MTVVPVATSRATASSSRRLATARGLACAHAPERVHEHDVHVDADRERRVAARERQRRRRRGREPGDAKTAELGRDGRSKYARRLQLGQARKREAAVAIVDRGSLGQRRSELVQDRERRLPGAVTA